MVKPLAQLIPQWTANSVLTCQIWQVQLYTIKASGSSISIRTLNFDMGSSQVYLFEYDGNG
jgi:hypothetical protein